MPGWILSNNMFMILRNEEKFRTRNKSKRNKFPYEILRPDIIQHCVNARATLIAAEGKSKLVDKSGKPVFVNVKGLGKNYMRESSRVAGIRAYTNYIQYFGLHGLFREMKSNSSIQLAWKVDDLDRVTSSHSERWAQELHILKSEFPSQSVDQLLVHLVRFANQYAQDILKSKQKDDERGPQVIPDYGVAHLPADRDKVVKVGLARAAAIAEEVNLLRQRTAKL
eukprot:c1389_g1_i1.p1 GENE.c1389_g1_i1~~c1389_g1_i1.p1  ORF type:complete len:224 (+),score=52.72 c1389_g1_i1:383-1054(+)